MSEQGDNSADTVPCKLCGEPIRRGARKCNHCNSWQRWHLNLAACKDALALLVALVGMTPVVVPIIGDALSRKDSALQFVFQTETQDEIVVLVNNSGDRPGVVSGAFLDEFKNGLLTRRILKPAKEGIKGYVAADFVEPQVTKLLGFRYAGIEYADKLGVYDHCSLQILYRNFRESETSRWSTDVKCEDISQFMQMAHP